MDPYPELITTTGGPGTGKTTRLVEQSKTWPQPCAVVVYLNEAAKVLQQRGCRGEIGTIYSLASPWTKKVSPFRHGGGGNQLSPYHARSISRSSDPALHKWVKDSPGSRRDKREVRQGMAELHRWVPGDPEPALMKMDPVPWEARFAASLYRWLASGADLGHHPGYKLITIDEAQDMSALELAATRALLAPDGELRAVGDPGQAIFSAAKGLRGNDLPAAWARASQIETLRPGYRVGKETAGAACRVLRTWYQLNPDDFAAPHHTPIMHWEGETVPSTGLILCRSRRTGKTWFTKHGLKDTPVVPNLYDPNKRRVLSTIHAAKGAEADEVYLLNWSRQRLRELEKGNTEELRVLYTAMTRARRRLWMPYSLKRFCL